MAGEDGYTFGMNSWISPSFGAYIFTHRTGRLPRRYAPRNDISGGTGVKKSLAAIRRKAPVLFG